MNKICEMIAEAMVVAGVVAVGLFIVENYKIMIQIMWIFSAIGIAKSLLK